MDDDEEMQDFWKDINEGISSRPLEDVPDVHVVQPDQMGNDSKSAPKEKKTNPEKEENLIVPVPILQFLESAPETGLDGYHGDFLPDSHSLNDKDESPNDSPRDLDRYPVAVERYSPPNVNMDTFEPAIETHEPEKPREMDGCAQTPAIEDHPQERVTLTMEIPRKKEVELTPPSPEVVAERAAMPAIEMLAPEPPMLVEVIQTHVPHFQPSSSCAQPAIQCRPPDVEKVIVPEQDDKNVSGQKNLKEIDHKLSLKARQEFETEMDEKLKAGDLDDIKEWITPYNLTKCATNSLEKSLEVSYRLKRLSSLKGPDAEDFDTLATSVEEFALQLLEPLKSDDMKRAIFEGQDFDRVLDEAVKYRQKKFVSHPVVYNLMMRHRWTRSYFQRRYGNAENNMFKWILLNLWTFVDVFLFPIVFLLLGLIHLVTEVAKKREDVRVVFLFNASWKYARAQLLTMQSISDLIMKDSESEDRIQYATVRLDNSYGPVVKRFTSSEEALSGMSYKKEEEHPTREKNNDKDVKDDKAFHNCFNEAQELFKGTEERSNKVLVVMTDDKFGSKFSKDDVDSLKKQGIKVIFVGLGVHPEIKELKTMATNDENFILFFNDKSDVEAAFEIRKCIKGKDFFDRYVEYFTTPYFIFLRDTLSYMALLGLHFAMCLQPSTIQFTAIEWIIVVFFLGRFMMEINQVITEKNTEWKEKYGPQHDKTEKSKETPSKEKNATSDNPEKEEKSSDENEKQEKEWKELCRIVSSYFNDWWNMLDVATLTVFLILVGLRVFNWSEHTSVSKNRLLAVAGYLYGLNAMFLTLRVFGHIMEYKKSTGSIQIALFQIISAVIAIFGQFLAATVAFSLAITKIYMAEVSYNSGTNGTSGLCENKNGLACWWSSTTHLAWSLLGIAELTPLESSDDASDFLAKLLYGLFLVMGVVMLMNMMIALLSNTYQNVEDNAFYEWSYKKATTIRTYIKYHPVPVPFNVISLSFMLLRHIYGTIDCTRCKRSNSRTKAALPIVALTCSPQTAIELQTLVKQNKDRREPKRTEENKDSLFESLIIDLQADYFAVYGYRFPDDNKLDLILKETDGSHQLIGHIAQRVFRYDQIEMQRLKSHGPPEWDLEGIEVVGQRLIHFDCKSEECYCYGGSKRHGAKYLQPLSEGYPGFEVLIQESGERRFIAIGVVTKEHYLHEYPGWYGNTAGYHIDDGKIFDRDSYKVGREGNDAMAHRGDLLGCKILYDKQKDNKLPVSFTLNGRVIGEANLTYYAGFSSNSFYPFVGTGCKGISLLFRMCPKVSLPRPEPNPAFRDGVLEAIFEQLQMIGQKQVDLERKIEDLSRR